MREGTITRLDQVEDSVAYAETIRLDEDDAYADLNELRVHSDWGQHGVLLAMESDGGDFTTIELDRRQVKALRKQLKRWLQATKEA